MLSLGALAFASPWLLAGLAALPVLWWLLRVTPPAPRRLRFPAIRLLLGLTPREETPARTPLWLILFRMLLAGLVILGLAQPLLNPSTGLAGKGPLVLVVDNGWAAAHDWPARQRLMGELIDQAEREDRHVVVLDTAPPPGEEARPSRFAATGRRCQGGGAVDRAAAVALRPPGRARPARRASASTATPMSCGSATESTTAIAGPSPSAFRSSATYGWSPIRRGRLPA